MEGKMRRLWITLLAFMLAGALGVAVAQGSTSSKKTTKKTSTTTEKSEASSTKIDINSASKEDLMTLKGIGDATADKIIAGRPYKTKRDLVTKKIVGHKEYQEIKDKIVAHGGETTKK